jgi:hypothetical protein
MLLLVQATSEFLMNTYGSPSTSLAQCITLKCSCQKPLRLSPIMRLVDHSHQRPGALQYLHVHPTKSSQSFMIPVLATWHVSIAIKSGLVWTTETV